MKSLEKYISESIGQESDWVYFCIGANKQLGLMGNDSWNPKTVSSFVDDKFIVVSTSYDMYSSKAPILSAWQEKYKENVKYIEIVLCSYGDKKAGELITKMGKSINGEGLTLAEFLNAFKAAKGRPGDVVNLTYNKLRQKITKLEKTKESTEA